MEVKTDKEVYIDWKLLFHYEPDFEYESGPGNYLSLHDKNADKYNFHLDRLIKLFAAVFLTLFVGWVIYASAILTPVDRYYQPIIRTADRIDTIYVTKDTWKIVKTKGTTPDKYGYIKPWSGEFIKHPDYWGIPAIAALLLVFIASMEKPEYKSL